MTAAQVIAGEKRWTVDVGDNIDLLRALPDACVDAIVTDPPYFLTNASGSGFMGKEWDSLSPGSAVVVAFFKSMRLVCGTDVASIARAHVNTELATSGVPPSKEDAPFAEQASKATTNLGASVPGLVITKAEGLALCAELSPDLTGYLLRLPTHALLVEPPSFLEPDGSDTALRIAAILLGVPAWLENETSSIETDLAARESRAIAGKSGPGFAAPYTSGTNGAAAAAAFGADEATSNTTTSSHGGCLATIQRVTSLPCVRHAIRRFTRSPNRMGITATRKNHHATVKSTDLMRWLVRLITPPGGIVLDLFAGSGSTGVACSAEGFRFIGFELDPEYAEIARARITGDLPLFNADGGGA